MPDIMDDATTITRLGSGVVHVWVPLPACTELVWLGSACTTAAVRHDLCVGVGGARLQLLLHAAICMVHMCCTSLHAGF